MGSEVVQYFALVLRFSLRNLLLCVQNYINKVFNYYYYRNEKCLISKQIIQSLYSVRLWLSEVDSLQWNFGAQFWSKIYAFLLSHSVPAWNMPWALDEVKIWNSPMTRSKGFRRTI